jgi:hypothetical protein
VTLCQPTAGMDKYEKIPTFYNLLSVIKELPDIYRDIALSVLVKVHHVRYETFT